MLSRALSFTLLLTLVGCVSPATFRNPASADFVGNGGSNARVSVDGTVFDYDIKKDQPADPALVSVLEGTFSIDASNESGAQPVQNERVWINSRGEGWRTVNGKSEHRKDFDINQIRALVSSLQKGKFLQVCPFPNRISWDYARSYISIHAVSSEMTQLDLEMNDHGNFYCRPDSVSTLLIRSLEDLL